MWKGISISRKTARDSAQNTVLSCQNGLRIAKAKLARNTDPYQVLRLEAHVERCKTWLRETQEALAAL
jgi:hypothetical protein